MSRTQCFKAGKLRFPGAELFAFICVHLWLKILLLFPLLPATPSTGSLVLRWVINHESWYKKNRNVIVIAWGAHCPFAAAGLIVSTAAAVS